MQEKELERIGSMPRVFLDGLGVGISLIDATTGHIRFANKQYCRILGYSEQELTRGSVSFLELTHPDDRERSDAEHRRLLSGEIPQYRLDKRCLRGDGNLVWVHVTVNAIRGSKGEVRWCSAAVEDIGATKILEQQLAAAQRVAGLATWNFAVKTNSSETSPSFNALFGVSTSAPGPSLDELIGRVHPDDKADFRTTVRRAVAGRAGYTHEYRIVRQGGEVRWLREIATCVYDAAGDVTNLIGATIDVTDMRTRQGSELAPKPIRDIFRHIETNWNQPLSINELAKRYGVSSRYVFKYFASQKMSLARHIKQLRLRHARQKLSHPKPGTTVTQVATECGFSNLGHFAKDYNLEFGEKPSKTLAGSS